MDNPGFDRQCRAKSRQLGQRGFTLIELIMVIVLAGVLAVFVAPRLNTSDFNARGFHDETLAFLRFAQKSAIAKRRTVCVAFTSPLPSTTATLTIATVEASAVCNGTLAGPNGEPSASIPTTAQQQRYMGGITYSSFPPLGFSFNGLGQPSAGQTIRVASGGVPIPQIITVEAETGYVHD